uniref:HAT C-terminal dimerisation domain-containing protein n=1 Tax=Hordeum vulgare subsp. vulgare TaxID=112509 RepID=A0A8I6X0X2_HORVV
MVNGVEHAAGNANNEQDESTDNANKPKKRLPSKCSPGIQTHKRQKDQEAIQNGSHEGHAAPEQKNPALPVLSTNQNRKNQGADQNISREELVRILAMHGTRMVEQDDFWKLVADLNPAVKIPSHVDLMMGTFNLFDQEKAKLKDKLTALPCRVCLSAYVWHYSPLQAFLCLTVHYIDDEWKKQKKIIGFSPLDPSCSAEEVSHTILRAIGEWGLDDKVFSIILDDAFNDDSVASNVKARLQKRNKVAAKRSLFVARYATHLLDEVIQVGLDELDTIMEDTSKCSRMYPTPSLAHYRKRRYASADDWKKAQKICKYLQDFSRYKELVHKLPSPDKVFDKVWNVKEKVLRNTDIDRFKTHAEVFLRDKEEEGISIMRRNMEKKFKKCWKVCFLHFCMPMVMDPKFRLEHIKSRIQPFTVPSSCTVDDDIDDFICEVHDTLLNLYGEYSNQAQEPDCTSWSKIRMGKFIGRDILHELYIHTEYPYRQRPLTELDYYLQEAPLPAGESSALQWWKEHSLTYPSIGRMARDILALPRRTDCKVATRTARLVMSASGNKNRVEGLVCIQDWLAPAGTTSVESNLQN